VVVELRHVRYFVAVAEELHFGRAALRLRIAQPALSQQIQRLEAELGVRLLVRNRRRVALSPAGAAFLPEARAALAQAERAARVARRTAAGELGRLVLGFWDRSPTNCWRGCCPRSAPAVRSCASNCGR
jgi:DNA-binding transcriptional LysR family regulator